MAGHQKRNEQKWTYTDYCAWSYDERWELIDGVRYNNITPTPPPIHQKILGALFVQFANHLEDRQCEVYVAPFDVRLPEFEGQNDDDITTVVQPDVIVVCDPAKLDHAGCKGAPDLIVEILTPITAAHDFITKFILYEKMGVREFWLVYPIYSAVMVFKLTSAGTYGRPDIYGPTDRVEVPLLGDLKIDLANVFANTD